MVSEMLFWWNCHGSTWTNDFSVMAQGQSERPSKVAWNINSMPIEYVETQFRRLEYLCCLCTYTHTIFATAHQRITFTHRKAGCQSIQLTFMAPKCIDMSDFNSCSWALWSLFSGLGFTPSMLYWRETLCCQVEHWSTGRMPVCHFNFACSEVFHAHTRQKRTPSQAWYSTGYPNWT